MGKSFDELSDEGKALTVILGVPVVIIATVIVAGLSLTVSFWEAWVALHIWHWHVPQALPGWLNWWTLGWVNVTVCIMIRTFPLPIKEDYLQSVLGRLKANLIWGFGGPGIALVLGWGLSLVF